MTLRHLPVLGLSPLRPLPAFVPAGPLAWTVPRLLEVGTPPDSAYGACIPLPWGTLFLTGETESVLSPAGTGSVSHCGGFGNCSPLSWSQLAGL